MVEKMTWQCKKHKNKIDPNIACEGCYCAFVLNDRAKYYNGRLVEWVE